MDWLVLVFESLSWVKNWLEYFPFNFEEVEGFHGSCLVNSCNASNKVAYVSDFLDSHGMFVLGYWEHAECVRCICTRCNSKNTWKCFDFGSVNRFDFSIMMWRTEDFTDNFVWKSNVVTVPSLSRYLRMGINQCTRLSYLCPCTVSVMNVRSCRLRFFATYGLWNKIEISWRHIRT